VCCNGQFSWRLARNRPICCLNFSEMLTFLKRRLERLGHRSPRSLEGMRGIRPQSSLASTLRSRDESGLCARLGGKADDIHGKRLLLHTFSCCVVELTRTRKVQSDGLTSAHARSRWCEQQVKFCFLGRRYFNSSRTLRHIAPTAAYCI
jgi:hypothetical protein